MPFKLAPIKEQVTSNKQQSSSLPLFAKIPGQATARAAESVLGFPGDVLSAGHALTKFLLPTYGQVAEKENLPNILPTSQDLRQNVTQRLTGQSLEPEGTVQQVLDRAFQIAPLALATGGGAIAQPLATSLGSAVGSQVGSGFGPAGEILGGIAGGTLANVGLNVLPSRSIKPKVDVKEASLKQQAAQAPLQAINQEIKDYKSRIKDLAESRAPHYEKASQLDFGIKGNVEPLKATISEVRKGLKEGISPSDRRVIQDNLASLQEAMQDGSGKISLRKVKNFQKNFNDQIFNRDSSLSFKRQMGKVTKGLNDFIEEVGGAEHTKHWKMGEQATQQLKKLERGQKEFLSTKRSERMNLKSAQQNVDALDKIVQSAEKTRSLTDYGAGGIGAFLGHSFGGAMGTLPGATLGYGLKKLSQGAANEIGIAAEAFKKHPEILKEYGNFLSNAAKYSAKANIQQLNKLGEKIEKVSKEPISKRYRLV